MIAIIIVFGLPFIGFGVLFLISSLSVGSSVGERIAAGSIGAGPLLFGVGIIILCIRGIIKNNRKSNPQQPVIADTAAAQAKIREAEEKENKKKADKLEGNLQYTQPEMYPGSTVPGQEPAVQYKQNETPIVQPGPDPVSLSPVEFTNYLNSLGRVYVVFSRSTGDQFPSVDPLGNMWVFSVERYASDIIEKYHFSDYYYRELSTAEFYDMLKKCLADGIRRFRFNMETADHYADMDISAAVPDPFRDPAGYYGAGLNQLIIRYTQNRAVEHQITQSRAYMYWSIICHELHKNIYFVPVSIDGMPEGVFDPGLHLMPGAAETLLRMDAEKKGEKNAWESLKYSQAMIGASASIPLAPDRIYGGEGYTVSGGGNGILHFRVVNNQFGSFICGFTNIFALRSMFGSACSIGIASFGELTGMINDSVAETGSGLSGVVINPGYAQLMLGRADLEAVEKERKEKTKIFLQ